MGTLIIELGFLANRLTIQTNPDVFRILSNWIL